MRPPGQQGPGQTPTGPPGLDPAADVAALRRGLAGEWPAVSSGAAAAVSSGGAAALVVLCGLPGTGKSHFAAALGQRVDLAVLNSDRIRKVLVGEPRYSRGEHRRVFAAAHLLLEELLAGGYRVVFDATNLTEWARQPLYDIAERVGAPVIVLEFTAPEVVVRQRLERRAAGDAAGGGYADYSDADWRIYCRMREGGDPIGRPYLPVDSTGDIEPILDAVARRLGGG